MAAIQVTTTPTMASAPANHMATLVDSQADTSTTTRVDTLGISEARTSTNTYITVSAWTAEHNDTPVSSWIPAQYKLLQTLSSDAPR